MRALAAACALLAAGCAPDPRAPVQAVPESRVHHLVRDPGPPPNDETPPVHTLYAGLGAEARPVARVVSVAPGGEAWVTPEGALVVGGRTVDTAVLPGLARAPDGTLAYTRSPRPPETDVYRLRTGGAPERVTHDGRSERPFLLPDGTLLWTSSAGAGRVGWFREGKRLNSFPEARVPAWPDRTRFEDGRVVFDAGDGLFALDPATGAVERQP